MIEYASGGGLLLKSLRLLTNSMYSNSMVSIARTSRTTASRTVASLKTLTSTAAAKLSKRPFFTLRSQLRPSHCTFCSSIPRWRSEDPGGKPNGGSHSTVYDDFYNILESPEGNASLSIASINSSSTTLSDGLVVATPLIILNGTCFMWDPPNLDATRALPNGTGWEEWEQNEEEIWKLLDLVKPKPEVLILGTGSSVAYPPASLRGHLHTMGIQLDVQSSQNAASTFNVLSEEGRQVAIAVIPSERQPTHRIHLGQRATNNLEKPSRLSPSEPSGSPVQPFIPPWNPTASRTFSTFASRRYDRPAASPTETIDNLTGRNDEGKMNAKGGKNQQRRRGSIDSTSNAPPLGLQHFVYCSRILALYRSYLRATRPIPNPGARRETVNHLRHDVFDSFKGEVDLGRLREKLARAHRELKLHQGTMLLSAHGPVEKAENYPKLRGGRQFRTSSEPVS